MTDKKNFEYTLQLDSVSSDDHKTLQLQFTNHDDIFKIVDMTRQKEIFSNINDAAEFAVGLKLFTEVMLRNRENDLFTELQPAIQSFMSKLKQTSKP